MANTSTLTSMNAGKAGELYQEEANRLRNFIRSRVPSSWDAEDIVQDVFYQFIVSEEARPIENATAWLYRVTRNRIIDLFRKKKEVNIPDKWMEPGGFMASVSMSDSAGAEATMARNMIWEELFLALDELPDKQRQAFEAHEIQGLSFKELSAQTGESVQTLISRKRYAVIHLKERLKMIYKEFIDG